VKKQRVETKKSLELEQPGRVNSGEFLEIFKDED
jgi:hypothetical protein